MPQTILSGYSKMQKFPLYETVILLMNVGSKKADVRGFMLLQNENKQATHVFRFYDKTLHTSILKQFEMP